MVPANRWPVGNSHSAPATIPHVPVMVIALGVTGVRASASPTGVSRRARNGRSTFSIAVRILVAPVTNAAGRGSPASPAWPAPPGGTLAGRFRPRGCGAVAVR